ncbi:hypothetical protein BH11BAC7_BH11BAC7_14980 [soil metagenome]
MRITKLFSFKIVLLPALFILLFLTSCGNGKFRAAVKENGKYGYLDESGDYAIDAEYEEAWSFIRGSAVVKKNGHYGLIDKDGKFIVEPIYDSIIPFSSSCLIVEKDSAFGFIATGDGKVLLKPEFDKVFYYTSELCVVQKGKSLGIVNAKAKLVCPVIMQDFKEMYGAGAICLQNDTSDEVTMLLSLIQGGDEAKKGLLNSRGEVIVMPEYDDIFDDATNGYYYSFIRSAELPNNLSQDTNVLYRDNDIAEAGKYGIIDTAGKIISEPQFEEMPVYGDKMFRVKKDAKYGYTNANGKVIIEPAYDYATAFSEEKAIVSIGSKVSIIDNTGKVLVENLGPGSGMYRFFNGLARCRSLDGKYGFLDATGKRVIEPYLEVADDFENNRAIVSVNNRYGLIDRTGKFIVPNEYDFFYDLGNGYYQTKGEDGKAGVVDSVGHVILEPVYDEVFHLQTPYFTVEKDGLNGCYDLKGKEIYPPLSSRGVYFYNGRCMVIKENKYGIIDSTGKEIIPTKYDSIGMFFKGRASVLVGNKFGAVDSTGKEIIAPKYQELRPFLNGFAVYKEKGKFGYLSNAGKVLTEAKFDEASVFVDPDRKEFE